MKHTLSQVLTALLLLAFTTRAQFSLVDSTFNDTTKVDRTLSFAYSTNATKLILARGETENLAKNKRAYIVYTGGWPADSAKANGMRLVDDNTNNWIEVPGRGTGVDNRGTYITVDLQAVRLINRVVMKQPFEQDRPTGRILGYTIEAGTDTLSMVRMLQQPNNTTSQPDTTFEVIAARFVRIVLDVVDPGKTYPTLISEVRVYGTGYLSEGAYVSKPKPATKTANWGSVKWDATLPSSTSLSFEFRSGDSLNVDSTWSPWSAPITTSNALFGVFEPRKYIQYRVSLKTSGLETPQLNSLTIDYDTNMVASSALASIDGRVEPILKKVDVTYRIALNFTKGSYGVDTVRMITPTPIIVQQILKDNVPISPRVLYGIGEVKLAFPDTISTKSELVIEFTATLYLDQMSFPTEIISSKAPRYNPQRVERKVIGTSDSWTIETTGFADRLLVDVRMAPNPFTPNGDGKNDETAITFYVSNLSLPRGLSVFVYDVSGRRVRTLYKNNVVAGAFVDLNAIRWDGKNDDGVIVRPGVYIIRVDLAADEGRGEVINKTVTVAY